MVGLLVGITMVMRGRVDCEGWDMFSLRHGRPKKVTLHRQAVDPELVSDRGDPEVMTGISPAESRAEALSFIREHVREGDFDAAALVQDETVRETGSRDLPERVLLDWTESAQKSSQLGRMIARLKRGIAAPPTSTIRLKLLLASAHVEEDRPISATDVIDSLDTVLLLDFQLQECARILAEADRQRAAGVLEVDVDD